MFDQVLETSVSERPDARSRPDRLADEDVDDARRWTQPPAPVRSPAALDDLLTLIQPAPNNTVFLVSQIYRLSVL